MSETKHTPGPWSFGPNVGSRPFWEYIESDEVDVCRICQNNGRVTGEANARLITAAPDMLAALEAIVNGDDRTSTTMPTEWIEQARAAIRKAKGE